MQNNGDDQNKSPKKSWWQRAWKAWCDWWKLTWESYVVEIQDRILMSWKRIYKFAGIAIIPILYGVICSVAIWNPVEEIGRAPAYIMDNDYSVLLVSDADGTNASGEQITFGAVKYIGTDMESEGNDSAAKRDTLMEKYLKNTGLKAEDVDFGPNGEIGIKNSALKNEVERNKISATIFDNAISDSHSNGAHFTLATKELGGAKDNFETADYQPTKAGFSFSLATTWDVIRAAMLPKADKDINKADTDYKFESPVIVKQENVAMKNIRYSSDTKWNKENYTKNAGYMQVNIPAWYSANLINYASLFLEKESVLGKDANSAQLQKDIQAEMDTLKKDINPLNLWTTFERNFLYGYLFNVLSGMMGSQVLAQLPSILNVSVITGLGKYLSIDGATLNSIVKDPDDNGKTVVPDGKEVNDAKRYVVSDSSYLSQKYDGAVAGRGPNATLFGNVVGSVTNDNTAITKDATTIGGKFINTVKLLQGFAANLPAQNALSALTGNTAGHSELVDKLLQLNDKVTDGLKAIEQANNYSLLNNKMVLADSVPTVTDSALVLLNYAMYQIATTGNTDVTDANVTKLIDGVVKPFWNKVVGTDLPTKWEQLFNKGETILESSVFEQRFNKYVSENSKAFNGATTIDEVLPNLFGLKVEQTFMGLKVDDVFTYKVQGAEFGIEGIGLGIFFLTVGLFVGCILLSFIFDRAKRLTKAKWSNWYISKWLLMITVSFVQVTLEVWVVYAAGWHMIGATAMCYVWLWLLASDIMFVTIVQALWFSIKDEIIGKFLCVIVLVTSIAAGGGEFPAISEFAFFGAISYVVPFTYVIKAFDLITFGVSLRGTEGWSTQFIFQQWGIELIYIALFMSFGMLVGARLRMREMDYGSHYGFAVAGAMRALGRDTSNFQILRKVTKKGKKRYYYNWRSLNKGFDPELYFQCREMYKFAGEFKWWQRKHHDFVQKPNYSDEEIITRNE